MTTLEALAFVEKHGVVLESARGPVPNLAAAVAGQSLRGNWWSHPKARVIFRLSRVIRDSKDVLVCRLVGGKVTFVHRRLWPALVRLGGRLPRRGLAAVRQEHTASGAHRTIVTPFPRWAPKEVRERARRLDADEAVAALGADLLAAIGGRSARPRRAPRRAATRASARR